MTSVVLFIQQVGLAMRLHAAMPIGPVEAVAHVWAAREAATERVSAELLLGMAYVESHYDPLWVSRLDVDGARRTSRYPWRTAPPGSSSGSLYCGPLQTYAHDWRECLRQRSLGVAYNAAARELEAWLADRRVRGDLARALAGYGCGNHGVTSGKCNRYPSRVIWQARRISSSRARARA